MTYKKNSEYLEDLRIFVENNSNEKEINNISSKIDSINQKISTDNEKEKISCIFILSKLMDILLKEAIDQNKEVPILKFRIFFILCLKLETAQTFTIINEFINSMTLNNCISLWPAFEIYKTEIEKQFEGFRNMKFELLKMCVGLIQRSSRSSFPFFRSDILLYLSSILPFDDKSGLNMKGIINTPFNYSLKEKDRNEKSHDFNMKIKESGELKETGELDNEETGEIEISDFSKAEKIWKVQDFISMGRGLLSNNGNWESFCESVTFLFSLFEVSLANNVNNKNNTNASSSFKSNNKTSTSTSATNVNNGNKITVINNNNSYLNKYSFPSNNLSNYSSKNKKPSSTTSSSSSATSSSSTNSSSNNTNKNNSKEDKEDKKSKDNNKKKNNNENDNKNNIEKNSEKDEKMDTSNDNDEKMDISETNNSNNDNKNNSKNNDNNNNNENNEGEKKRKMKYISSPKLLTHQFNSSSFILEICTQLFFYCKFLKKKNKEKLLASQPQRKTLKEFLSKLFSFIDKFSSSYFSSFVKSVFEYEKDWIDFKLDFCKEKLIIEREEFVKPEKFWEGRNLTSLSFKNESQEKEKEKEKEREETKKFFWSKTPTKELFSTFIEKYQKVKVKETSENLLQQIKLDMPPSLFLPSSEENSNPNTDKDDTNSNNSNNSNNDNNKESNDSDNENKKDNTNISINENNSTNKNISVKNEFFVWKTKRAIFEDKLNLFRSVQENEELKNNNKYSDLEKLALDFYTPKKPKSDKKNKSKKKPESSSNTNTNSNNNNNNKDDNKDDKDENNKKDEKKDVKENIKENTKDNGNKEKENGNKEKSEGGNDKKNSLDKSNTKITISNDQKNSKRLKTEKGDEVTREKTSESQRRNSKDLKSSSNSLQVKESSTRERELHTESPREIRKTSSREQKDSSRDSRERSSKDFPRKEIKESRKIDSGSSKRKTINSSELEPRFVRTVPNDTKKRKKDSENK